MFKKAKNIDPPIVSPVLSILILTVTIFDLLPHHNITIHLQLPTQVCLRMLILYRANKAQHKQAVHLPIF
jgi:hypothetical protein